MAIAALAAGVFFASRQRRPSLDATLRAALSASFPAAELQGTAVSIEHNAFILDVPSVAGVAIPEASSLRRRSVILAGDAVVSEQHTRSSEELQRARAAYPGFPPRSFELRTIEAADLREGDLLRVAEADYGDLRFKTAIKASRVTRER